MAFAIIEKELGIARVMTAAESVTLENVESKVWLNYLEQVCEVFRGEIPHVKHPKLDLDKLRENKNVAAPDFSRLLKYSSANAAARKPKSPELEPEERPRRSRKLDLTAVKESLAGSRTPDGQARRARKRRSYDKIGNVVSIVHRWPISWSAIILIHINGNGEIKCSYIHIKYTKKKNTHTHET